MSYSMTGSSTTGLTVVPEVLVYMYIYRAQTTEIIQVLSHLQTGYEPRPLRALPSHSTSLYCAPSTLPPGVQTTPPVLNQSLLPTA